jgi:hypothetical protein
MSFHLSAPNLSASVLAFGFVTMFQALLFVVLLPLFFAMLIWHLVVRLVLLTAIWMTWIPRGRTALVIYSDSPTWRDFFAAQVLPRLEGCAVVLNWSERRRWRIGLAALAFHYFGGYEDFNPMVIVFRLLRLPRAFRFYKPFRDFKHGDPESVNRMAHELFKALNLRE